MEDERLKELKRHMGILMGFIDIMGNVKESPQISIFPRSKQGTGECIELSTLNLNTYPNTRTQLIRHFYSMLRNLENEIVETYGGFNPEYIKWCDEKDKMAQQIMLNSGFVRCTKCGELIAPIDNYCGVCGTLTTKEMILPF